MARLSGDKGLVFEPLRIGMVKAFDETSQAYGIGSFTKSRTKVGAHRNPPGINGMLVEVCTSLLAHKLAADRYEAQHDVCVPSTWFQHLKEDYAPKWLKRRFPVKTKPISVTLAVEFTRYATYPKASVDLPEVFGPIVLRDVVGPSWEVKDA